MTEKQKIFCFLMLLAISMCEQCKMLEQRITQLEKENHKMRLISEGEILELKKELLRLHKENLALKQRLVAYENANTPPSKQRFIKKKEGKSSGKLGRPTGAKGSTRPVPKPTEIIDV